MRVPKSDASVSRAAACREQAGLVRTPGNCFHSCLVLREFCHRLITISVPYHELVIIAAARQLLAIVGPFEPTDLLLMAKILVSHAVLNTEVAAEDKFVF